jgi:hypothetical protein
MSKILYSVSPAGVKEFLDGDGHFVQPARLLSDLTEEQTTKILPGAPFSIAQVLSHAHFWQEAEIAKATGQDYSRPKHLDDTFAPIQPGTWSQLVNDFLAGIETLKKLADEKVNVVSSARDDTDLNYDLAGTGVHNAYHFGQIVLLRRMQGLWPPKEGEPYDF